MAARLLRALFCLASLTTAAAQQVFINELHYDNTSTDSGEGVEIAGPAGTTLAGYSLYFYNGQGGVVYQTQALSGTIPSESGSDYGAVWVAVAGIQNGAPDGVALVHVQTGNIVHAVSYEGPLTATDGPAAGQVLADIGVDEDPAPAAGLSLQLTGTGGSAADFTWTGPVTATPGLLNAGQTMTGVVPVRSSLTLSASPLTEGGSGTLTISLAPHPVGNASVTLSSSVPGMLNLPATIHVDSTGSATISYTTNADGMATGYRRVTLTATPSGVWPVAGAELGVIDTDRPVAISPGSLRLMTYNVRVGVGQPDSADFEAVREVVERISPDVLIMQEVESGADFSNAQALAQRAGFPTGAAYRASQGDDFTTYQRGDIPGGSDINVLTFSRYPITRRVQCGRGVVAGRVEMGRYPLLTALDIPWLEAAADPVIVNVHLKADPDDASAYRRAVEALRLRQTLTAEGYDGATSQIIVAGDFNATDFHTQQTSFQSNVAAVTSPGIVAFPDDSMLPLSYRAGADLLAGITLPYATFPHSGMNPAGLTAMTARQADGQNHFTFNLAPLKLDYYFVSAPIAARQGPAVEIYNSSLEHAWDGLPKRRDLPAGTLSTAASDHFALFADIPLTTLPVLSAAFSQPVIQEGGTGLTLQLTLTPAPAVDTTVLLSVWRDGRVILPEQVTILAGQSTLTIPAAVPALPAAQAHRQVSILATATGVRSATAGVIVRNEESAGQLVITRYTDPDTGTSPRAMEIMNTSGVAIDFSLTPLRIRRYANGDAAGITDALGTFGVLPAGAVLVIGDEATGDALVAQGLLPAPLLPFNLQAQPAMTLNAAGHAAFLLDSMAYNGNDAMEVLLNDYRCDVLGTIGQDPGFAWSGPGTESTADRALTLRPGLLTGSTGWTQPGLRFTAAPSGLQGFGVAPSLTDPYLTWAATAGLTGLAAAPASDPDLDGADNLLEYALLTHPLDPASIPALALTPSPLTLQRSLRSGDPFLTYLLEYSPDLTTWTPAPGTDTPGSLVTGGQLWDFTPDTINTRAYYRQRASR